MDKLLNAILIHNDDNVITATESLRAGSKARFKKDKVILEIVIQEEIPKFHKIALVDIDESKPVFKYGQLIGNAIKTISKGTHVHDHNITSPKKIT